MREKNTLGRASAKSCNSLKSLGKWFHVTRAMKRNEETGIGSWTFSSTYRENMPSSLNKGAIISGLHFTKGSSGRSVTLVKSRPVYRLAEKRQEITRNKVIIQSPDLSLSNTST